MVTRMHTFNIPGTFPLPSHPQILFKTPLTPSSLPVFGATITPFGAPNATLQAYSEPIYLALRDRVNDFIRNSGTFDAVIDFDEWLRDPSNHSMLNPIYNSGDYLHPNEAGYQVIGEKFPLELFTEWANGVNTFQ